MNRFTHSQELAALLENLHPQVPREALLVDGKMLVQVLKDALYELHEGRRRLEGAAQAEVVQRIRYLDAVLSWIKSQPAQLVVMGRR